MLKSRAFVAAVFVLSLAPPAARAVEEPFCGGYEECVDDVLRIVFEDGTSEVRDVVPGQVLEARIVIDVKSRGITGFSYGLRHDPLFFQFLEFTKTIEKVAEFDDFGVGTLIDAPDPLGFYLFKEALGRETGFSTYVDLRPMDYEGGRLELPVGDGYLLSRVKYKVLESPLSGSKIFFTRSMDFGLSIRHFGVRGTKPRVVENALIFGPVEHPCAPDYAFYFGPHAKSGDLDLAG